MPILMSFGYCSCFCLSFSVFEINIRQEAPKCLGTCFKLSTAVTERPEEMSLHGARCFFGRIYYKRKEICLIFCTKV